MTSSRRADRPPPDPYYERVAELIVAGHAPKAVVEVARHSTDLAKLADVVEFLAAQHHLRNCFRDDDTSDGAAT